MESTAVDRQVRSAVEEVCDDPAVVFVVGFGSQLSKESAPSSDIDLAIKFGDELSDQERFEKRCLLSGMLQQEDCPFIDLSDIEALPVDVAHDAVNGELLCGDVQAFEGFQTDIRAEFAGKREELRDRQRAVIERIAEDGLRG
jgi:predicted nucleotidyltransferase